MTGTPEAAIVGLVRMDAVAAMQQRRAHAGPQRALDVLLDAVAHHHDRPASDAGTPTSRSAS